MSKKKPTMSHTPAERKLWHDGAGSEYRDFVQNLRKGNYRGKFTPRIAKRGIFYAPL